MEICIPYCVNFWINFCGKKASNDGGGFNKLYFFFNLTNLIINNLLTLCILQVMHSRKLTAHLRFSISLALENENFFPIRTNIER